MKKYPFKCIISIGVILTLSGCSNISDNDVLNTDMSTAVNTDINTSVNEDVNATVDAERKDFSKKYARY